MVTARQKIGALGEQIVVQKCACPRCKRAKSLKRLPPNFRCADVICDFCGYLAQVKACTVESVDILPSKVLGAAWEPQKARMDAAIYFPLFIVLVQRRPKRHAIYFLSADLQEPLMFIPRLPLSKTAVRAGWRGFLYDTGVARDRFVRLR
jgi:hypothetical protein